MRPVGAEARVARHRAGGGGLRTTFYVLIALAVLAVPAAIYFVTNSPLASGGEKKKVELSVYWWGGPERAKLTEQALDLYTERYPNVTFKKTWQANQGYYDKLATKATAGGAPDIFQIDDNMLSEYAGREFTLDLTGYVESKKIDVSRMPESLANYGVVNRRTVGVAGAANTAALVYDRTLTLRYGLQEPQIGWTWEKLINWAAEFSAKSGNKVYGTMDPSADYKALWMWLRQKKKDLYRGNALGFTEADLREWYDMWASARNRNAAPPADILHTANSGDVTKQLVVTGKAGTSFVWSNQVPELSKGTEHELGIVAYPGDPTAQWARASMYWAGYRSTAHPDIVAEVINFLVNDVDAGRILGTERGLSPNLDVRALVNSTLSGEMQDTVRFETTMSDRFGPAPAPPPKGHASVRALLIESAENVQFKRATSQQAAQAFFAKATAALAK